MVRIPTITTERLLMRMYTQPELEGVYRMLADADVTRFYPPGFTVRREDVLASLPGRLEKWRYRRFAQLGVFERETGKLAGYCGLQPFDKTAEIELFYGFFKEFWGRGFATEAGRAMLRFGFETAGLESISAGTHPENTASQKVLEKIGFTRRSDLHRFYGIDSVYFTFSRNEYVLDEATYNLDWQEIVVQRQLIQTCDQLRSSRFSSCRQND